MSICGDCCKSSNVDDKEIYLIKNNEQDNRMNNLNQGNRTNGNCNVKKTQKPNNKVEEKKSNKEKMNEINVNADGLIVYVEELEKAKPNCKLVQLDNEDWLVIKTTSKLKEQYCDFYNYTVHIDPTAYDMITNPDSVEKLSYYYDKGQKVVYIYKTGKEKDNDKATCKYKNACDNVYNLTIRDGQSSNKEDKVTIILITPTKIQEMLKNQGIELQSKKDMKNGELQYNSYSIESCYSI